MDAEVLDRYIENEGKSIELQIIVEKAEAKHNKSKTLKNKEYLIKTLLNLKQHLESYNAPF